MRKLPKGVRLKNGSYEARATVNGTKICLHGKDLKELVRQFKEAKAAASAGYASYTVDRWFEEWMDCVKSKRIKSTGVGTLKRNYERTFGFYLGARRVTSIDPMSVQKAMNAMQGDGVAVSSIQRSFGVLKECLEFAVVNQVIGTNPCSAAVPPMPDRCRKEAVPFSREEQDIFLTDVSEHGDWYEEMFYLMFLTGLRVGELGALRWSDVDFERKQIAVRGSLFCQYLKGRKTEVVVGTKTASSVRYIPFLGEAEEMLRSQKGKVRRRREELGDRWRSKEFGDLVFVSRQGSTCNRYVVQKAIDGAIRRINARRLREASEGGGEYHPFRKAHPHLFRHTFCTRCFEAGMSPKVVQGLMGHSDIGTTLNIYTHVMKEKQDEELAKFGSALTGLSKRV